MTDNENQTAVTTRVTGTQIEQWGEREIVRELVNRMMMFHPAAQEVGERGMLAAAQLAVMVGASPLPGLNEIHIWKDRKNRIHVDPGINYYRRRAREVGGGVRWTGGDGKPRPMTLTEKQTYGIAESQAAGICTGMRSDDFDKYWAMGVRFPEIENISSVTGIAIAGPSEAKSGRPAVWTAIKRAETDILRQLYPNLEQPEDTTEQARVAIRRLDGLGPTDDDGPEWDASPVLFGDGKPDEIITVDPETGEIEEPEPTPEAKQEPTLINGHWRKWPERPWDAETLKRAMLEKAEGKTGPASDAQRKYVNASLGHVTLNDSGKRKSIMAYFYGIESSNDLTNGQASALIDWISSTADNDWTPSAHAIDEAERVVKARIVELGQTEMELG